MFEFPGFHTPRKSAIENEVASLRREVSRLASRAGSFGSDLYDDTRRGGHEIYSDVVAAISDYLPFGRRRSNSFERVVRENPAATAAVVGLVVVGLVASVLYARRRANEAYEDGYDDDADE